MIAAIDPGLDRAVAAFFDLPAAHGCVPFDQAAARFDSLDEINTSATLPMWMRLRNLARWSKRIGDAGCDVIYVEHPSTFGAYSRHRNAKGVATNPEATAKLFMAIGAICAGTAATRSERVEFLQKPRLAKADAHRLVRTAFGDAHKLLPPLTKANAEDSLDAIFIGLWALSRSNKTVLSHTKGFPEWSGMVTG